MARIFSQHRSASAGSSNEYRCPTWEEYFTKAFDTENMRKTNSFVCNAGGLNRVFVSSSISSSALRVSAFLRKKSQSMSQTRIRERIGADQRLEEDPDIKMATQEIGPDLKTVMLSLIPKKTYLNAVL
jgi:hypothetical protein